MIKNMFTALVVLCSIAFFAMKKDNFEALDGAWNLEHDGKRYSLLFADGYCMYSHYDVSAKKFIETSGGPYTIAGNNLNVKIEFDSKRKEQVGKTQSYDFKAGKNNLELLVNGQRVSFLRVDDGVKNLAGNWRIIKRKQEAGLVDIPLRARRTLKLLTATRFQWAAINIETGEFSGTGGGTYTFEGGKYTEHIEFFSRDSSRVGMSLVFDGQLQNGEWIHSGKSSKGDPIYEIWGRLASAN